jgi:hypothetical protein
MVCLVRLHHLVRKVFGFVAATDLFQGEYVMHVWRLVDAENLEPWAAFAWMRKNNRGHALASSLWTTHTICTALPAELFEDPHSEAAPNGALPFLMGVYAHSSAQLISGVLQQG